MIKKLQEIQNKTGDIPVAVTTVNHQFADITIIEEEMQVDTMHEVKYETIAAIEI